MQYIYVTIYLSMTKYCLVVLKSGHTNFNTHNQFLKKFFLLNTFDRAWYYHDQARTFAM